MRLKFCKRKCLSFRQCDLASLQAGVKQSALEVEFETNQSRQQRERQTVNAPVNAARKLVANSSGDNRRSVVQNLRRATKMAIRKRTACRLRRLNGFSVQKPFPQRLIIHGEAVADRTQIWPSAFRSPGQHIRGATEPWRAQHEDCASTGSCRHL
jgi:hypothetical protein